MKKAYCLLVMVCAGLLFALPGRATITTGVLSASSLCTGSNVKVPFTVTGTYNTGNLFTAQLSDANGSFASPVSIGTLAGITSDTIAGVIPAGTLAGTGYRIRVVANNPGVTGSDNGANLTIATGASAWAYVGNKGFSGAPGDFGRGTIQQGTSQILFGADGTPYVAYTDDYSNYNYVANVKKFDGTNWVQVGSRGFGMITNFYQGAYYTQLAQAPDGTLYAAYRDLASPAGPGVGTVTVVKFNGTDWVLVGQRGFSASLAATANWKVNATPSLSVDASGTPWVAYTEVENTYKRIVAKFNGTNWVTVGAFPGASIPIGEHSQLVFDAGGAPYLALNESNNSYRATVKKFDGTNWVTVGSAGISSGIASYPKLVKDDNGILYLSYIDVGLGEKMCVMKFNGTNWVAVGTNGFSPGKAFSYASLAIDHNGTPYVGFQDGSFSPLRGTVMKFDGTNWVSVGPLGFTPSNAWPVIVGIGNNNTPYAFFGDASTGGYASVMKFSAAGAVTENTIGTNQSVCSGTSPATLTGTAPTGGTGSYTYLWQSSTDNINFAAASGTNNGQNYSPPTVSQPTWYTRLVVSGCSAEISNGIKIAINIPVSNNNITTDQSVCAGSAPSTLNGSVPAGGDGVNYTYQWQTSTDNTTFTNIAGATNSNYSPSAISQPTWFRRSVTSGSGSCATAVSAAIKISITPAINNNTITADQSICAGSIPATLTGSVPAGGDGANYTYQWQISTDNSSFNNISGANASNCSPQSIFQSTWYRRVVSSGGCSHTSTAVGVTVTSSVTNNTISGDQAICTGTTPVAITGPTPTGGNGSYTYQWQSSTDNTNFTAAAGTNNAQNYSPAALSQTTWFRRMVTSGNGSCATVFSPVVKITINAALSSNTITADQSICASAVPAPLSGSVPAGGDGVNYSYQWQSSTDNTNFAAAAGTNNGQNYSPAALAQTTWFRRMVTSGNGSCAAVVSSAIKISINPVISNNTITAGQSICAGSAPAALGGSVPSGGDGLSYNYQWQSSTDNNTFNNITGATSGGYSPPSISQNTWFKRTVFSAGCSHTSAAVAITVTSSVTGNTISSDQSLCAGATPATLNGSAPSGGDGTYTYQWQSSTDSTNFTAATGTNNGQNYSPATLSQTTWFRRMVTSGSGSCATVLSVAVKITINAAISSNTITGDQSICAGSVPALLNGSVPSGGDGVNYTYQWQSSTDNINYAAAAGTNNAQNYSPATLTQATWFRRMVTSGSSCAAAASTAVKISINPALANNTITGDQSVCAGSVPAALNGSAPSGGDGVNFNYQWQSSIDSNTFNNITGATSRDYSPPSISLATWFRRIVTAGNRSCGSNISAAIKINVSDCSGVAVPNVFSPNGDGINDTWVINFLSGYPNCHVTVFNRSGSPVFVSTGYQKPWDGNFNNKPVPIATYYYVIDLRNGTMPVSGAVTVLK